MINLKNIFALLMFSILLQGCPKKVIQFEDRDIAGLFDGRWIITSTRTSPVQKFGEWRVDCRHEDFRYEIEFKGGAAKLTETQTVYVSTGGEFHFEFKTEMQVKESTASEGPLSRKGITIIYTGLLDSITGSGKGTKTMGIAQFNNRGCETQFDIQRIDY